MSLFPGVALITGAASGMSSSEHRYLMLTTLGIGQATAITFAKEGCKKIVLADRNEEGLQETQSFVTEESADCEVLIVQTDVSSAESVQNMVDEAVKTFGRVDYACNAAGIGSLRKVRSILS
jgi:NAD(P)-dependent dehydrogenase (short-subunit alcohol dehydrogenase family)